MTLAQGAFLTQQLVQHRGPAPPPAATQYVEVGIFTTGPATVSAVGQRPAGGNVLAIMASLNGDFLGKPLINNNHLTYNVSKP